MPSTEGDPPVAEGAQRQPEPSREQLEREVKEIRLFASERVEELERELVEVRRERDEAIAARDAHHSRYVGWKNACREEMKSRDEAERKVAMLAEALQKIADAQPLHGSYDPKSYTIAQEALAKVKDSDKRWMS